jgi:hypothetical protein
MDKILTELSLGRDNCQFETQGKSESNSCDTITHLLEKEDEISARMYRK